ncbi:MAG: hypothetical protein UX85_C0001G0250 [Candidatus Beckwithbacteria bacterium GW2011_GWB1_47_15]|uniref:Uncharacterized protein n=1 Tax=Candidatus Beckwithbacteria bacterium GW2011_GWB1_47_15 TaxID=1618371 RepID=A0A0G1RY54_9BACT|nr:MAG: coiled-coil 48..98 [Candidatus Beckwithbacteria bacterium GW2011_GWC1_49_16]AQS30888.1 hypothetical protein [uncultured bacterium]KKU36072.1 MAG: hypothetical protein UX50_C0001G0249 [Candidatus Beckwithbacteria bacterium GW2011_GWA1_46_30]KKU62036.1 MAG: hypothetical protein UX85_C0001G0250 [Candidatus Beckwithbacteria bacterium GW2011_GWB1_47_15]KKU72411.1 MAG: hypothetical protein UX97_C0001G0281 [Candidatus Beckwithbacteria bacterium GW2011_GWA2_47_25]OGD49318.1 MAG: hypothetical p
MKKWLTALALALLLVSPANASPRGIEVQNLETLKERLQERLEERITTREEHREELDDWRATLSARLKQIRDERKLRLAAHLTERFNQINQKYTEHVARLLNRMRAILAKLETRVEEAGGDAETEAAIAAAYSAIAEAETANETQAAKEYELVFDDEAGLRSAAATAKQLLKDDLGELRDKVHQARKAVVEAIRTA